MVVDGVVEKLGIGGAGVLDGGGLVIEPAVDTVEDGGVVEGGACDVKGGELDGALED